jgi:hypothetical protein
MGSIGAWRFFFLAEGLFFTGLSLGILGSTPVPKSRQAAWVLLAVGVLSLLLGLILWTLQAQREKSLRGQAHKTILRPLDLKKIFDSLLHGAPEIPLLKGRNFLTEARMILKKTEFHLEANKQLVIHHCVGRSLEITVGDKSCRLDANGVLRLAAQGSPRKIEISALEDWEDEERVSDARAPQILLHIIEESYPL